MRFKLRSQAASQLAMSAIRPQRLSIAIEDQTLDREMWQQPMNFMCPVCPSSWLFEDHLNEHIRMAHSELAESDMNRNPPTNEQSSPNPLTNPYIPCEPPPPPKHQNILSPELEAAHQGPSEKSDDQIPVTQRLDFACHRCYSLFESKSALDSHINQSHCYAPPQHPIYETEDIQSRPSCIVCGFLLTNVDENEILEHFIETGILACSLCNLRGMDGAHLHEHIRLHIGVDNCQNSSMEYNCDVCGNSFGTQTDLLYHARNPTTAFRCAMCRAGFCDAEHLEAHRKIHPPRAQVLGQGTKPLGRSESSSQEFCEKSQITNIPTPKAPQIPPPTENLPAVNTPPVVLGHWCCVCQISFPTKSQLRSHNRPKDPGTAVQCPACPGLYLDEPHTQEHIALHHKLYCRGCKSKFSSKNKFDSHTCPKSLVEEVETHPEPKIKILEKLDASKFSCEKCQRVLKVDDQCFKQHIQHLRVLEFHEPPKDDIIHTAQDDGYAATFARLCKEGHPSVACKACKITVSRSIFNVHQWLAKHLQNCADWDKKTATKTPAQEEEEEEKPTASASLQLRDRLTEQIKQPDKSSSDSQGERKAVGYAATFVKRCSGVEKGHSVYCEACKQTVYSSIFNLHTALDSHVLNCANWDAFATTTCKYCQEKIRYNNAKESSSTVLSHHVKTKCPSANGRSTLQKTPPVSYLKGNCTICSTDFIYTANETAEQAFVRHTKTSQHKKRLLEVCILCDIKFTNKLLLREHNNRIHIVIASAATKAQSKNYCWTCHAAFSGLKAFQAHNKKLHSVVQPTDFRCCDLKFTNILLLREHNNRTHIVVASAATKAQSKNYCWTCHAAFSSPKAFKAHNKILHSFAQPTDFRCCDCSINFSTQKKLRKHLHTCSSVARGTFACEPCDKAFGSRAELVHHTISSNHKPVKCAGRPACQKAFKNATDMLQHLESGACSSKIDRAKIDALVRKNDTQNTIMIAGAQPGVPLGIEGVPLGTEGVPLGIEAISEAVFQTPAAYEVFDDDDDDTTPCPTPRANPVYAQPAYKEEEEEEEEEEVEGVLFTPGTNLSGTTTPGGFLTPGTSALYTPTTTLSGTTTPAGFFTPSGLSTPSYANGSALIPIAPPTAPHPATPRTCAICHTKFKNAKSAQQHMLSPVHASKIYHCPAWVGDGGKQHGEKKFKTLSSLVMHVDRSEKCGGGESARRVVGFVESLAAGRGLGWSGVEHRD